MNAKKLYFCLIGAIGLMSILILVGAFEINGILQHKSKDIVSLETKAATLNGQLTQLAQDKLDIAKNSSLNDIAEAVVPQDKQPAEAIREIVDIAAKNNIPHLSSITLPASTLGGSGGIGTVSSNFTNPNSRANQLTQLTPVKNVKGLSGVYTLQITVQQTSDNEVAYSDFLAFLSGLEKNRRTSQVSGISIQPDSKAPGRVAFTLTIEEYIKP